MSAERDWQLFWADMRQAVDRMLKRVAGMTYEQLVADVDTQEILAWNLHVLGEASNRIPPEIKAQYPSVPWDDIRAMRNRIIHVYHDIDTATLWETVTVDLVELKPLLQTN